MEHGWPWSHFVLRFWQQMQASDSLRGGGGETSLQRTEVSSGMSSVWRHLLGSESGSTEDCAPWAAGGDGCAAPPRALAEAEGDSFCCLCCWSSWSSKWAMMSSTERGLAAGCEGQMGGK